MKKLAICFLLPLIISVTSCKTEAEIGYQPSFIPIRVSVNSRGNVNLSAGRVFATPIGIFDINASQTLYSLRQGDTRVLIVRVDNKATVYELSAEEDFQVEFVGDDTLYTKVALEYQSDSDVILELESIQLAGIQTTSTTSEPTPTPKGIHNPTQPVQAGTPVLVDDFSLTVADSLHTDYANTIGVTLVLQNIGNRQRLFWYRRLAISIKDDLGNEYSSGYDTLVGNYESKLYDTQQVEIESSETLIFKSKSIWTRPNYLQYFVGSVSPQAKKLMIEFNGFGPFEGI